ncbi:glycerol dehydrogenase [Xylariales sp. PMI_506]|nr:glycerol dehydrogenase [Xylariales sp. PMI_506]
MASRSFTLNTGAALPAIGLGTWQSTEEVGIQAVKTAIAAGYRHLDLAWRYGNEKAMGEGIRQSGIPREELFLTDKLWQTWHSRAEEALNNSLQALGVEYLDLWLMHWPLSFNPNGNDPGVPKLPDGTRDLEAGWDYIKTWQSMEGILAAHPQKVRAIGVSNFSTKHLQTILDVAKVIPAVNQVELHPSLPQDKLAAFCKEKGIQLVAHSPLGSPTSKLLTEPTLIQIAEKYGKSPATCMISWGIQKGWAVLPKSASSERIKSNIEIIDLAAEDMAVIDKLGQLVPCRYTNPVWANDIWLDDEE